MKKFNEIRTNINLELMSLAFEVVILKFKIHKIKILALGRWDEGI